MTASIDGFLRERKLPQLEELHAFWCPDREMPEDRTHMERAVRGAMVDAQTVTSRLKLLPGRVLDVLQFVLAQRSHSVVPTRLSVSLPGSPADFDAAVRTLVQRGFVEVGRSDEDEGLPLVTVPKELAETALACLRDDSRKLDGVLTLHGFLASISPSEVRKRAEPFVNGSVDLARPLLARRLADPPIVAARVAALPDPALRQILPSVIREFGGVLARSHFSRIASESMGWDRRAFRDQLEKLLLGTAAYLSLEEYGINLMEDVLVVFGEIVGPALLEPVAEDPPVERVASSSVNFLSDLSALLAFVDGADVRVTQKNDLYKTTTRKFLAGLVSKTEGLLGEEELFGFLVRTAQHLELVRVSAQHRLLLTEEGKSWETVPLYEKLRRAFAQSLLDPLTSERDFHQVGLRKQFASVLASLDMERWYDPMCVPFLARNRYLVDLDRTGAKARYQSAFQHGGGAPTADPAKMSWNLFQFTVRRLFPLGIVDLGLRGERVVAVRLSSLGATILGIALPSEGAVERKPLIVNPDFEVLVFAEKRDYNLVYQLDKFCVRIRTENIYHYRLTRESVSQAIVSGMSADDMIRVLADNSRNRIPQNVEFSIRDWAGAVRFVSVRRAFLLEAEHPETIDRIMALPSIQPLVKLRVSPTVLALRERPDAAAAVQDLRNAGVYVR
jgi:XPB/Ssl2-like helicase family protein